VEKWTPRRKKGCGIVLRLNFLEDSYMKKSDYAHLGAKARLEQLQEEIAAIHKAFPGLKHTTPLTASIKRTRGQAQGKRRPKAVSRARKAGK
jgi:hypothetical protein